MAGSNTPEKLITYRLYKEGTTLVGVVDVDLTGGESLSDTISGAGILGEVESQTLGHTSPITMKINFRGPTKKGLELLAPQSHHLELRGSHQSRGPDGNYVTQADRIVVKGTPKTNVGTGKFEVGKAMGNDVELAIDYIKREFDGTEVLEIDKFNFIHRVNGRDVLADVRGDLGI